MSKYSVSTLNLLLIQISTHTTNSESCYPYPFFLLSHILLFLLFFSISAYNFFFSLSSYSSFYSYSFSEFLLLFQISLSPPTISSYSLSSPTPKLFFLYSFWISLSFSSNSIFLSLSILLSPFGYYSSLSYLLLLPFLFFIYIFPFLFLLFLLY